MSFFRKIRSTLSNSRRAQRGVANPVFINDGSEGVVFTPIHETNLKTPYHSDNARPGPSKEGPYSTLQRETQQPRTKLSWLTFSIFTILILGSITAIVIVIIALRDPTPPTKKTAPMCSSKVEIPLTDNLVINCELNDYKSFNPTIVVTTPQIGSKPVNLTLRNSGENRTLTFSQSSDLSVQILGSKMQCDSYGIHQISITVPGKDVFTQNVTVAMSSVSPNVTLTVERATKCTANSNVTDFIASCATWSGCNKSSLNLILIAENASDIDFELPFKCKTNYTHVQGWYVNCSGRIDKAFAKTSSKVQCYPSLGIPKTKDLMPCNLTNNCIAKETRLHENITIICSFSSLSWTNISISVYNPSPSNETVLLPNDTINGWKYTKENENITLTGPQASCSKEGMYWINITDKNESRLRNVTVEIKGYLKNNTTTKTSNSCQACESYNGCNGHYTLRIEPNNTSFARNISQTCVTRFSDYDGWKTACEITPMSGYNVSGICRLVDNEDIEPNQTEPFSC